MVAAVRVPVTVKLRRGVRVADARPAEAARRLAAAGAAAIVFHPRAAVEEYEGRADHRVTAEVVRAVDVPVVASGDIDGPQEALRVVSDTGCAAVAIGRPALGNPWLFGAVASGRSPQRPPLPAVVDEIARFAADARIALGDARACVYMRKFYPWYLAGYGVPKELREALLTAPTLDAALGLLAGLVAARTAG
jgi:tRNA-dihydrouridine synthase